MKRLIAFSALQTLVVPIFTPIQTDNCRKNALRPRRHRHKYLKACDLRFLYQ